MSPTLYLWYCFHMQLHSGMIRQHWECRADFYMAITEGLKQYHFIILVTADGIKA